MKGLVRKISFISLAVLFLASFVGAQDSASFQRDFRDICPDTLIGNLAIGFYGGHFTTPNWYPEGGNGYLAVVSRDDYNMSQLLWDCSNDIVAGSVIEKPVADQPYSRITAILKYELPLEVWTIDNFAPGLKVLDNGFFEANVTRKLVLLGGPGAPLNFTCYNSPGPCGAYTYFWHISGEGIAYGTGDGDYYEGQMVRVKVTQNGLGIPPVDPNKNPNWDGWPVENITLTPIN